MLYIVRHGVTDYNANKRFQGTLDIPLNNDGVLAAKNVSRLMKDIHLDRIYSSDLIRARKTAEIIAVSKDMDIILDSRLREIHMGKWQGRIKLEIEHEKDYIDFRENPHTFKPTIGESFHDLTRRVEEFHRDIPKDLDVLVVTHGLVILAWLNIIEKKDIRELYNRDFIENCEVIAVDLSDSTIKRNIFNIDCVGVWAIEE